MTIFFSFLVWAAPCLAGRIDFPPLTGRVVDRAHVLNPEVTQRLTDELAAQERSTGQQVVVAIVPSLQGQTIEDYGYQLGRAWGIGQKGKDTGAILLVAPNERKVRIEVGYGLEGTLTDAKSSDIIDEIVLPDFKAGNLPQGIEDGTAAILRVLNGQPVEAANAPIAQSDETVAYQPAAGTSPGLAFGLGILFFFILVMLFMFSPVSALWLLGTMTSNLGGSSWYGGSSSSGGFSGGGGSFGGGGASGSW